MSRNSRMRSMRGGYPVGADTIVNGRNRSEIVDRAIALYGGDAPTAAAYCALDAWCEGNRDEYHLWLDVFLRLRN